MKTFEEINKYYKFPLKGDEYNLYILTSDNQVAFNVTNGDSEYYNKIIQKLNDPQSIDLNESFKVVGDFIMSTTREELILMVRGWGMLTGIGAHNMDLIEAAEIQMTFLDLCCERLNVK